MTEPLEHRISRLLEKRRLTLALAESCTGGLVSHRLTNVPGISRFLKCAIVAYSNDAKSRLLGVPVSLIRRHGAVSAEVAAAMASGALKAGGARVALGITGIAGPTGGTKRKPVGLVYVGVATSRAAFAREFRFRGTRTAVKSKSATAALRLLLRSLEQAT